MEWVRAQNCEFDRNFSWFEWPADLLVWFRTGTREVCRAKKQKIVSSVPIPTRDTATVRWRIIQEITLPREWALLAA
jgi:hypothetical protein